MTMLTAPVPAGRFARVARALLVAIAGVGVVTVGGSAIPDSETQHAPAAQRLAAIHAAAQRDGWGPQCALLRAAATRAYQSERLAAAEAWFHVFSWASLFALPETEFFPRWVDAINQAGVGHRNLQPVQPQPRPLAANASPGLQRWLVASTAFSAEFFFLLDPVDFVPQVLRILDELHRRDAARFNTHASLALAIAVVYDLPPPPIWPHGQVGTEALPRAWPAPADAFNWWIRQEQLGRTYHRLARLPAAELKFVIDATAPFAELEWAQQHASVPLNQLARAYSMIRYRNDRVTGSQFSWPGPTYRLADILAAGGICPDQAYFATQVGKARGVPTLFIYGAGNDGRHAWFGYLDGGRQWQLDAGRYAEQRYVTGQARDPQTWREFTDHELQFLSERFRELPSYRPSRVHAMFAADFLAAGNAPAAALAARKSVSFERRNAAGWEILIAAARQEGRDARTVESLLREAALAFQRHPDLEAQYLRRLAGSLRERGQLSEADAELRRIALKNRSGRSDIAAQQARDTVMRAASTQPLAEQIRVYNGVIDTQGRGAGTGFFDEVVVPFALHLMQLQRRAEAVQAIERARRTLRVEPNSQLEQEFAALLARVRGPK
jgi:hypothetical protein